MQYLKHVLPKHQEKRLKLATSWGSDILYWAMNTWARRDKWVCFAMARRCGQTIIERSLNTKSIHKVIFVIFHFCSKFPLITFQILDSFTKLSNFISKFLILKVKLPRISSVTKKLTLQVFLFKHLSDVRHTFSPYLVTHFMNLLLQANFNIDPKFVHVEWLFEFFDSKLLFFKLGCHFLPGVLNNLYHFGSVIVLNMLFYHQVELR